MSPLSLKQLWLLSFLSTLVVQCNSTPAPYPNTQYVDHALRKRAGLKAVKTTFTNEQTIDWIPIESQGIIAKAPPTRPEPKQDPNRNVTRPVAELENPGIEVGPPGTVPIPRTKLNFLASAPAAKKFPGSKPAEQNPKRQYANKHWYAASYQTVANHGCSGSFSTFKPYVKNSADFSLLQIAIVKSSVPLVSNPSTTVRQSVEAGWINFPNHNANPHLFTYFTTTGHVTNGDNLGGWDQDIKGWVQVDSTYFPGSTFGITVEGGTQYALHIEYYLYSGNWWLWVIDRWIGYYPASIFSANQANPSATLADSGDIAYFYGEIYQGEAQLTTTDMGSGQFAATGYGHSAFIANMNYIDTNNYLQTYTSGFWTDDAARYTVDAHISSGTNWGSYVYLGGPGAGGVVGG